MKFLVLLQAINQKFDFLFIIDISTLRNIFKPIKTRLEYVISQAGCQFEQFLDYQQRTSLYF